MSDTSIACLAELLPNGSGPDLTERLANISQHLREAPLTEDGRALFEAAERFLATVPEDVISADHAMGLLFITRFRYYNGDGYGGLPPATKAVELAEKIGDNGLSARAFKMLGVIHNETGNYPDAVSMLGRALQAAKLAGDFAQEADILSNLGLAHQNAGHYAEAVPCYDRAVEVVEAGEANGNPAKVPKGAALANTALACLHMRDFPRGIAAAERAVETLDDPQDVHEQVLRTAAECYYARLLLEVRNVGLARVRAKLARKFAEGSTKIAEMYADVAQGLVDAHDPATRDLGLSRLQRVVNESRKGHANALRDALGAIVRGYEAANQPNSALVYLHEVVQLNGDSRVRNVLQHHRIHVANVARNFNLDIAARDAIQQQEDELRFKRLSLDALRECMQVLEKNSVAAEMHDDDTGEHCYRVGALAKELALKKGMDSDMCTLIDLSARLHDIGKLRVPDSVLLKPGKFTPEERAIMEKHCEHGWELVGEGGLAQLFVAQEIALNHHERWDGTGYPNKRKGNMIPLAARVTALADVFDALTHRRCYKEAWSIDDALREIAGLRGKHFDPELTDLFLELIPELRGKHGDLDYYLGAEARNSDFIAGRLKIARELKTDYGTFDVRR